MKIPDIAIITTAISVLVILTESFTQLLKGMFPKIPPQISATVIALILTVCAVMAYISINNIPLEWYMVVGAIVAGFMVSYTAQYGYDKLHEIVKLLGGGKDEKNDVH